MKGNFMRKIFKVLGATVLTLSICTAMSVSAMYAKTVENKPANKIEQMTQAAKAKQDTKNNNTENKDKQEQELEDNTKFAQKDKEDQGKKFTDIEKFKMQLKFNNDFETTLKYFVSIGKITQADADAALKLINNATGKINFSDLPKSVQKAFKDMKNTYTKLTGEQKNAIKEAIAKNFQDAINKLVEGKIITEDQAKKLVSKFGKRNLDLTDDQKAIISDMLSNAKETALDELAANKVITAEQAEMLKFCRIKLNEVKRDHEKFQQNEMEGKNHPKKYNIPNA
jgi:hypothetical protein